MDKRIPLISHEDIVAAIAVAAAFPYPEQPKEKQNEQKKQLTC